MFDQTDRRIVALPEAQPDNAAQLGDSVGPVVEAAALIRDCAQAIGTILDELATAATCLELLDALLHTHHGNSWWEKLEREP